MKRVPHFIPDLPSQKEPRNLFITSRQHNSYIQASLGNCTELRSHFFEMEGDKTLFLHAVLSLLLASSLTIL